ncbi:MAG: SDR family oxidoreductase [Mesorhizobium sp.]|uniref:SDR family NAD(P)-dependent oxidoreductase n=1 Tax=Mesorhizobium sp. TaxID=1871066 RepID=UPI000FE82F7B|nr:SDR family oxidoreductase [Mesorhizobium sp.]RWB35295.1 MAG: SDR family oxidoreductase [Mesorhizobium sp.]RWD46628.1 MAG: SDR family oxidoreductase [Mesorhizobium sp.]RWE70155.1 MAG: SDR family oxidoreductase [Mesorhizobium sp.]TIT16668.1 MAG: SDR family oxidoreductase [Mesorhizobium sp.]TIX06131.1 MAG: SDR family oxidoreductase [Mesorhizobium sp.]
MDTGLQGKTVLVTGAASGIGRATALAFAREGAQLRLIDIDAAGLRETEASVSAAGVCVTIAVADLSTAQGAEKGIADAFSGEDGKLDVLVNNVGVVDAQPFDSLTDAHWQRTFDVNFLSNIRMTRALLPRLRESRGSIINNTSDLARQPETIPADYAALKTALVSVTKSLARAEAPHVRVNAVAPGPIWSPLWSRPGGFADTLSEVHRMPPRQAVDHEMKLRQLPLERMGEPEEVADIIVFLASERASFVTSSVWGVDGGSIRNLF